MIFFSPAKINLSLQVVGKRPDGYHSIQSVMRVVDFGDELEIAVTDRDCAVCSDSSLPMDSANLCIRARDLFRRKTGKDLPVRISLQKVVPMQAGLGGGSSNAATVLWGMNRLLCGGVDDATLMQWSAEIGSDIPFFFSLGSAVVTGRGECVSNVLPDSERAFWIVKPPYSLATHAVFSQLSVPYPQRTNALEEGAFALLPELAALKESLIAQGFSDTVMTGSGTALICSQNGRRPVVAGSAIIAARTLSRTAGEWYKRSQE